MNKVSVPLFSVVIPTRNRGHLLRNTISSVLSQDCSEYEIIVSDNNSSDNTKEVVGFFDNSKLYYFNTGSFLKAHESWNYACSKAVGKYILILGDDDYLLPGTLTQVKEVIEKRSASLIGYRIVTYNDNSINDPTVSNTIEGGFFSGALMKLDAKKVIRTYFDFTYANGCPPHPSAIVYARHLIDDIVASHGSFCMPPYPEILSVPLAVARSLCLYIIDKPLVVIGRGSNSQVTLEQTDPKKMWSNLSTEFNLTLFKGNYTTNAFAESLLRVKNLEPETFKNFNFSLYNYCCMYYENMINVEKSGKDIEEDLLEFKDKLSNLQLGVYINVRKFVLRKRIHRMLIDLARSISGFRFIRTIKSYLWKKKGNFIQGNDFGIIDIVSCAANLDRIALELDQNPKLWSSLILAEKEGGENA